MARIASLPTRSSGASSAGLRHLFLLGSLVGVFAFVVWSNSQPSTQLPSTTTPSLLQSKKETTESSDTDAHIQLQGPATTFASSTPRLLDFETIGQRTGTDKVKGPKALQKCLAKPETDCAKPHHLNPKCRTGANHFYHTMYNARLAHLSGDSVEPFQFLEVGFYNGKGYDAYRQYMPRAEAHSLEISCIEAGPRVEGKWPFGNFAAKHADYQSLVDSNRLHCGDATDYDVLMKTWNAMKEGRADPPPLKLVIDDAAHISSHMVTTVFFWFPKLAPGGLLVVEDIQPTDEADTADFRNHFLPQLLRDVHYCGDPAMPDQLCFPTLHRFLQSVHCEMHICTLERNDHPAEELSREESLPPANVFRAQECLFGPTTTATTNE